MTPAAALARVAAQTALLAAPEEDIPRLELPRLIHAKRLHRQAQQIPLDCAPWGGGLSRVTLVPTRRC